MAKKKDTYELLCADLIERLTQGNMDLVERFMKLRKESEETIPERIEQKPDPLTNPPKIVPLTPGGSLPASSIRLERALIKESESGPLEPSANPPKKPEFF